MTKEDLHSIVSTRIYCRTIKDGDGIFLRDDGTTMSDNLVCEIDDLVLTDSDVICESRRPLIVQENIDSVMKSRGLRERNDKMPPKEKIFDWNVHFFLVDNCCLSLDDFFGGPLEKVQA